MLYADIEGYSCMSLPTKRAVKITPSLELYPEYRGDLYEAEQKKR